MGPRVLRGVRGGLFLLGLDALMSGSILSGAFLMFREPDPTKSEIAEGALDDVRYAVPEWLLQVGLSLVAFGLVTMVLAWLASQPWYDGLSVEGPSARACKTAGALTVLVAFASGIVAVSVSWDASPTARLWGPIAGVAVGLALLTSRIWLPWVHRTYG